MKKEISIWKGIFFDEAWKKEGEKSEELKKLDLLYHSWEDFKKSDNLISFLEMIKREHATETGQIEDLYHIDRGLTQTLIEKGFVDTYIERDQTDINPSDLIKLLKSQLESVDMIFQYIKSERSERLLSNHFIKSLHQLLTQYQKTTEAINSLGKLVSVELKKGEYKTHPNNPKRSDGTVYLYCPPEQVASEMDKLLNLYYEHENSTHPVVLAAWFHHAFTQIHPFQDGNGRMSRLLTSFILIKKGYLLFTVTRDQRTEYIDALEKADKGEYGPFISFVASQQISLIEKALNYEEEEKREFTAQIQRITQKLKIKQEKDESFYKEKIKFLHLLLKQCLQQIEVNMNISLKPELPIRVLINLKEADVENKNSYWFFSQIVNYAKEYNYYYNYSLPKSWISLILHMGNKSYRFTFSLHYYGYRKSTIALGCFLEIMEKTQENKDNFPILNISKPLLLSLQEITDQKKEEISRLFLSYTENCISIGLHIIERSL